MLREITRHGYERPVGLSRLLWQLRGSRPPIPPDPAKAIAPSVNAMRALGTEKDLLLNLEMKDGSAELFWLNCWVAKELAGAINFASQQYGWPKRGMTPGNTTI